MAIGIALDSTYSYLNGLLCWSDWQQIMNTLKTLGFELYVPELSPPNDEQKPPSRCPFNGLSEFREHLGGELTLMLLQGIGQGIEVHQVDLTLYKKAILILSDL